VVPRIEDVVKVLAFVTSAFGVAVDSVQA